MAGFEEIAQHTFMLRTDSRICSNVYLIEEGGARLLVDSGDGLLRFGLEPQVCILTHGHADHSGGVRKSWPKVLLHKAEFSFKGSYILIPANAKPNPMEPLSFGSHRLEFFHTPGHTAGSICILDKKTGCLFSGDTKFAQGGVGRTDLGGSAEKLAESLALLDKLDYKLLCPGHGELEEKG